MTARIFKPAKNAMQSGRAKTREWQLDYEPEQPRAVEPLMGWTSSGDMKQQLTLQFDTREDAVAYCERKGIPYQVIEPKDSKQRQVAYADNFAFRRGEPWTHCESPIRLSGPGRGPHLRRRDGAVEIALWQCRQHNISKVRVALDCGAMTP